MRRTVIACALLGALAALPAISSADPPGAHAARGCSVGSGKHLGATYTYTLREHGTSCRMARKVSRGYHKCRRRNGGRDGRCGHTYGYSCGEHRFNKSHFSYDAKARCKKSGKEVSFRYTQNL